MCQIGELFESHGPAFPVGTLQHIPPQGVEMRMSKCSRIVSGTLLNFNMCRVCGMWLQSGDPNLRQEHLCVRCCQANCSRCDNLCCCHRNAEGRYGEANAITLRVPKDFSLAEEAKIEWPPKLTAYRKTLAAWPAEIKFLLVIGRPGAGKTYTAWAVARRLASIGLGIALQTGFAHEGHKIDEIPSTTAVFERWKRTQTFGSRPDSFSEFNATRLILDEFGHDAGQILRLSWNQFIRDRIGRRLDNGMPTMLLSVRTQQELAEIYGPEVGSRLQRFKVIELKNQDLRCEP